MLQHLGMRTSNLKSSSQARIQQMEAEMAELDASKASLEKELTEHKRIALTLQSSEKQYRRLFESAKDGILILNADTERIVDVNPFLIELLGHPYEYFIGKELWEIGVFRDIAASKAASIALQEEGYIRYDDLPLETQDGRHVAVEFVSNVYMVDSARIIQCNIRDITERKNAVETIRLDAQRAQTLLDLHLLSTTQLDHVLKFVIEACLSTTRSNYACIGTVNKSETMMSLKCWSEDDTVECGVPSDPREYSISDMGAWGLCIQQRSPVVCNVCEDTPSGKQGKVFGDRPLHRFIAIPVFDGDRIVAVGGVADKEGDYVAGDVTALSLLLQKMWEIFDRNEKKQALQVLEEQYRQSQKLEAIGQLAGGVAHDFNNILQAILGYGSMLQEELPERGDAREFVNEIMRSAERASALTRQLLAFSRRQILKMEHLDLNDVVRGISRMIRRLIGAHIEIRVEESVPCIVHADRTELEQILINLCLNGRDAMPEGGVLVVTVENETEYQDCCDDFLQDSPGRYARISITDNGSGMEAEVVEHVFEPFYTTKGVGKGTGLGLATVYGIVRQHHGRVEVASTVGKGTTFRVYLPIIDEKSAVVAATEITPSKRGVETILLAEDELSVQRLVGRLLTTAGYKVLLASNGVEALELFAKHHQEIDLCLLDVVMPKMGGRAVYDVIHPKYPQVRFLFASGYNKDAIHKDFVLEEDIELIQKPFASKALLERLRDILDRDEG